MLFLTDFKDSIVYSNPICMFLGQPVSLYQRCLKNMTLTPPGLTWGLKCECVLNVTLLSMSSMKILTGKYTKNIFKVMLKTKQIYKYLQLDKIGYIVPDNV